MAEINAKLRSGVPNWMGLGRELGLSRQALHRHYLSHPLEQTEPIPFPERRAGYQHKRPPINDEQAKSEFLGAFKANGDLSGAADAAGVSRFDLNRWLEHDESFSLRFNQAKAEMVERLEATAIERAITGGQLIRRVFRGGVLYEEIHEYRPSDAALIKLLSSLKPEVYGDKLQVTQTSIVKAVDAAAWESV